MLSHAHPLPNNSDFHNAHIMRFFLNLKTDPTILDDLINYYFLRFKTASSLSFILFLLQVP